ncbi:MAG: hypothetical protein ACI358_07230 [Candidatus Limimorpha sp.]
MFVRNILERLKRNRLMLVLTMVLGLSLLLLLGVYLAVPSYIFDPQPFKGDFIFNPYDDVDETVLSVPRYYDFSAEGADNEVVNSYEYGYSLSGARYLCINYSEKRNLDFPFMQSVHCKQFNIDRLKEKSCVVGLAHPSHGFKKGEMKNLEHYRVIEALSCGDNSLDYWDIALSSGHRVNIVAANGTVKEDSHGVNGFSYSTAVLSQSDNAASVCESLEIGKSYGVAYKGALSEVPVLQDVDLHGDTLFVSMCERVREMRFISQNGKRKYVANDVDGCSYVFSEDDTYIRVEIESENGSTLYLNPLVRHEFAYFFDRDQCKIMKGRTYFMWAVYIVVIFAFVKNFLVFIFKKDEN